MPSMWSVITATGQKLHTDKTRNIDLFNKATLRQTFLSEIFDIR